MELQKLKADRDAFAERLRAVIQGEINTFIADGGIHPESIDVGIYSATTFGSNDPGYILGSVKVSFGL